MKKLNFILGMMATAALMVCSNGASAQKSSGNTFEVGSATINIGAGLGRGSYGGFGYYGSGYYGYGTAFGVKAAVERGMWQLGPGVLSLGAEVGGSFSTARYNSYKSNILIVAVRSAYHFGWNVPNLDTYAGVSLGPGFRSYNYTDLSNDKFTKHDVVVSPGGFVGASYYFSPNIGVNVEAGYDITQIQGGIIFKLN
jgi:Outer membrane protein beta-barrel domain